MKILLFISMLSFISSAGFAGNTSYECKATNCEAIDPANTHQTTCNYIVKWNFEFDSWNTGKITAFSKDGSKYDEGTFTAFHEGNGLLLDREPESYKHPLNAFIPFHVRYEGNRVYYDLNTDADGMLMTRGTNFGLIFTKFSFRCSELK